MPNIWQFRETAGENHSAPSPELVREVGGSPLLATLLYNRGVTFPEAAHAFLNLQDYQPSNGLELPDMDKAVQRLLTAIDKQEAILIYGDFDVDGITGTSVLYETLHTHLNANVSYYIPDRATEGHGLHSAALIRLTSTRKIKLVVTTDTGITNFSEVSLLNGLGIDTIITDHHALPENLPPAIANVNSQRLPSTHPMQPLCGAGVAYKLCEILLSSCLPQQKAEQLADKLLDIVAVGTVVDMVPLTGENRYLVYRGLQVLNRRERPGFNEILEQAGMNRDAPVSSETLGFTIGPRLNALGRLERAEPGVKLITGSSRDEIHLIAAHLEFLNRQRRDLCDQTYIEAESHLQRSGGLDGKRAIILASPDWNPGIIGIVASRLIEKYHVPVFMLVADVEKKILRCSARSIPGFHLHDQLLNLEHYFLHFGGHAGAGGFAIPQERFEAFKRDLYQICERTITPEMMKPVIQVDAKLNWSQLNAGLIELVDRLAPFGMGNPSPKFVIEQITIGAQRFMGEDQRHTKLVLLPEPNPKNRHQDKSSKTPIDGIIWNFGTQSPFDLSCHYRFIVVPSLNSFQGKQKVQLLIEDYQAEGEAVSAMENTARPASMTSRTGGSSESATSPLASTPSSSNGTLPLPKTEESGQQWIDHRNREELGLFVSQLLAQLQGHCSISVFHEGKAPAIPMLDSSLLTNRLTLKPVDELILWDIPPSPEIFASLIQQTQPKVIHLAGGKYQTVPVYATPQNYLKLITQVLRQRAGHATPKTVSIDLIQLASQLATDPAVLRPGISLLEKIGMLRTQLNQPENPYELTLEFCTSPTTLDPDLTRHLEFSMFHEALVKVGQYRSGLLNTALETIRQSAQLLSIASYPAAPPPPHKTFATTVLAK